MGKYLTQAIETYRVDTETEATAMIEEAKKDADFVLGKYSCMHKEKKSKGEVIDEWYKLTLVKDFNDEKEPSAGVSVAYTWE